MANNCMIELIIRLNNLDDKDRLFKKLDEDISRDNREDIGAFIGNEKRYLFDGEVKDLTDNEILINGWVKWGISNDEVISIYKYLNDIVFMENMIIRQVENMNGIADKYTYNCNEESVIKRYSLSVNNVINREIDEVLSDLELKPNYFEIINF